MSTKWVKREDFTKEVTDPELLKYQPYYRMKGRRFVESMSGAVLNIKPGPPAHQKRVLWPTHLFDVAHLVMLAEENIISPKAAAKLLKFLMDLEEKGREEVEKARSGWGIYSGEALLIQEFGEEVGGLIHIGRSTGDLTGVTIRIAARERLLKLIETTLSYIDMLLELSKQHLETPWPTWTVLQQAQITSLAHYLMAWAYKAEHAVSKLELLYKTINMSPAGAAIGTGSDFSLNRERVAELLGFDGVIVNTYEAISTENKTFVMEGLGELVLLAYSIERFLSELYWWHTDEIGLVRNADRYCATSSIMPQKRNPLAILWAVEQIHRIYSIYFTHLVDEISFVSWPRGGTLLDALEQLELTIYVTTDVIKTTKFNKERARELLKTYWNIATDLAAELVRQGKVPCWRIAHGIVSVLCRHAEERGICAEELTPEMIEEASKEFWGKTVTLDADTIKRVLDPMRAIKNRTLTGGPAPERVQEQINDVSKKLAKHREWLEETRKALEIAEQKRKKAAKDIIEKYL